MTGILSNSLLGRYQSGSGSDPMNQAGGMEGYLSQFNVNPYWQQYLQNGQGQSGLLNTYAQQQQPSIGLQNPYATQYKPETPVAPTKSATDGLTIAALTGGTRDKNNAMRNQDVVLSNGQIIPYSWMQEQANKLAADPAMAMELKDFLPSKSGGLRGLNVGATLPSQFLLPGAK